MLKRIHVNQHVIKSNRTHGTCDPVLTVKTYKSNDYAHEVVLYGVDGQEAARVIYSPDKPLSCGATVWIESRNDVELIERPCEGSDVPSADALAQQRRMPEG